MKLYPAILAVAALMGGSGLAFAQQQYDSLGSPTPAPHQNASPAPSGNTSGSAAGNSMDDANNRTNAGTKGTSYTTGAGADKIPKGVDGTTNSGSTTPSDPTTNGGATPNGLTPE